MKIEKIETRNFKGYAGDKTFVFSNPIEVYLGRNGIGKTSLVEALRYGLTGVEPDGDMINKDAFECEVTVTLGDGTTITRIRSREKPTKVKINGKSSTAKAAAQVIEDATGIPVDEIKIVSSEDVVGAMRPRDRATVFLQHIPEKIKRDDLIGMIPDITDGMKAEMEAQLPADEITIDSMDDFYEAEKTSRKNLKAEKAGKEALIESLVAAKPEEDKESLKTRLSELQKAVASVDAYNLYVSTYNKALADDKRIRTELDALGKEYNAISATKPNPAVKNDLLAKRQSDQDYLTKCQVALKTNQDFVSDRKQKIANLANPKCLIDPRFECRTDKTEFKAIFENDINIANQNIAMAQEGIVKAQAAIASFDAKIKAYDDNFIAYDRKVSLYRQGASLQKSLPIIPDAPGPAPETVSPAALEEIQSKLLAWDKFHQAEKEKKELEDVTARLNDTDRLVKAFEEKGVVRTAVISKYLGYFESVCNDITKKYRPDVMFHFAAEDGVEVYMNTGKGDLPYENLSTGEKAFYVFVMLDLLNQLIGSKIIFLDEVSVLDTETFPVVLRMLKDAVKAGEFDHVIITGVDHDDTARAVEELGIKRMEID